MTDIEQMLRRLVREELARLLGIDPQAVEADDDADLRERAAAHAARIRGRSKAGAR